MFIMLINSTIWTPLYCLKFEYTRWSKSITSKVWIIWYTKNFLIPGIFNLNRFWNNFFWTLGPQCSRSSTLYLFVFLIILMKTKRASDVSNYNPDTFDYYVFQFINSHVSIKKANLNSTIIGIVVGKEMYIVYNRCNVVPTSLQREPIVL